MGRYPRVCKNGHVIERAEQEAGVHKQCRVCQRASEKKYRKTTKGRNVALAGYTKYRATPKGKAASQRYDHSEKGRDRQAKYAYSSKGMIARVRGELKAALQRREELG